MSDGYLHDDSNSEYLPSTVVAYERQRSHLPRDLGGFAIPVGTDYDSKDCIDCGVTYTTARRSSRCLHCE